MSSNSNSSPKTGKSSANRSNNDNPEVIPVISDINEPRPMPYLFEKELINKANKHIYVVDDFVPSRNTHHITAKFYAHHQQREPRNDKAYRNFIERPCPERHQTENHVYGWMPQTLKATQLLRELNFINAPKQRCCLTVYGEILQSDKITERAGFNGLRFHLQ
ncbi:uncharacterized protein LOC101888756 [Musca domestica]|uniref:Uncharacterized protein LOC101888756 n=1 Tax=Musca domestica TaxID=7370 RepID=A0A1I8MIF0_MUSDO|nr:uncharacterized protein LOC101888756 [Musca domestica]